MCHVDFLLARALLKLRFPLFSLRRFLTQQSMHQPSKRHPKLVALSHCTISVIQFLKYGVRIYSINITAIPLSKGYDQALLKGNMMKSPQKHASKALYQHSNKLQRFLWPHPMGFPKLLAFGNEQWDISWKQILWILKYTWYRISSYLTFCI